jgi:hypothetical protein
LFLIKPASSRISIASFVSTPLGKTTSIWSYSRFIARTSLRQLIVTAETITARTTQIAKIARPFARALK